MDNIVGYICSTPWGTVSRTTPSLGWTPVLPAIPDGWQDAGTCLLYTSGTAPDTAPEEALPLFREWAVDWENGCFALRRGEPYLVSGDEALKDRKSTRLNSSHLKLSRMPSSA